MSLKFSASIVIKRGIMLPNIFKKRIQKLMLVATTSTPVIAAKEKALKDAETRGIGENSKNSKNGDENSTNIA